MTRLPQAVCDELSGSTESVGIDRLTQSSRARLVVFFTRGMSLVGWRQAGILEREIAMYRVLGPHLAGVSFITYSGEDNAILPERGSAITVLSNRWRIPSTLYSFLVPLLYAVRLREADIFKTNQINGSWSGLIAKWLYCKPLVVRCGYVWSQNFERLGRRRWQRGLVRALERLVCRSADRLIVPTVQVQQELLRRHALDPARMRVIPNYVDTARFRPLVSVVKEPGLVCYLGRLSEEKNLRLLCEAVAGVPHARLLLIGDGPLREEIATWQRLHRWPVDCYGTASHEVVPALLNRADVCVLPSQYEGHPKALLEAMACGVPVIGTRVPGIQELIVHRQTGYLCEPSLESLREAIRTVLDDAALRQRLGAQGRAAVEAQYALPRVVEQELSVLQELERTERSRQA